MMVKKSKKNSSNIFLAGLSVITLISIYNSLYFFSPHIITNNHISDRFHH